jgi:hypothetical protein
MPNLPLEGLDACPGVGLLARGSSYSPNLPSPFFAKGPVISSGFVAAYSGGAAPVSHRLPVDRPGFGCALRLSALEP